MHLLYPYAVVRLAPRIIYMHNAHYKNVLLSNLSFILPILLKYQVICLLFCQWNIFRWQQTIITFYFIVQLNCASIIVYLVLYILKIVFSFIKRVENYSYRFLSITSTILHTYLHISRCVLVIFD